MSFPEKPSSSPSRSTSTHIPRGNHRPSGNRREANTLLGAAIPLSSDSSHPRPAVVATKMDSRTNDRPSIQGDGCPQPLELSCNVRGFLGNARRREGSPPPTWAGYNREIPRGGKFGRSLEPDGIRPQADRRLSDRAADCRRQLR